MQPARRAPEVQLFGQRDEIAEMPQLHRLILSQYHRSIDNILDINLRLTQTGRLDICAAGVPAALEKPRGVGGIHG